MKVNSSALLAVVIAGLFIAPFAFRANAEDDKPPVAPNRFKDKVAIFYLRSVDEDSGVMMRDIEFERYRNRWFVTGVSPDVGDPDDWTRDALASVAWEEVGSFYIFTKDQFENQVVEGKNFASLHLRF